jgi:hypothetical protein
LSNITAISGGVAVVAQVPICPASYNSYDYPRYVSKFNDAWADTKPAAINNLGQVAGSFTPVVGQKLKGFVRQVNGAFTPAPWYGPDYDVTLTGINDLGQFIGYAGTTDDPLGFFDSNGSTQEGYLPLSINNLGQTVGLHKYSTWGGLFNYTDGFLRDGNGQLTNLGNFQPVAINNAGQIAGYFPSDDGSIFDPGALYLAAVRNPDGSLISIKYVNGTFAPHPLAINDLAQVAGYYQDSNGHYHGFIADATGATTTVDFPQPSFTNNYITGINNLGQVVGWMDNGDTPRLQFVRDGDGEYNMFEPAGPNGTTTDQAVAINDMGEEIGTYDDGAATKGFETGPVFVEPFASFAPTMTDMTPSTGALTVWGSFTPCTGRTLNPVRDPMLLKVYQPGVAWASLAIPGGSFVAETGKFEFHGTLHGVTVDAYLWGPLSDGHFDVRVYATGVAGLPSSNPVTVFLADGDNMGTATTSSATIH